MRKEDEAKAKDAEDDASKTLSPPRHIKNIYVLFYNNNYCVFGPFLIIIQTHNLLLKYKRPDII